MRLQFTEDQNLFQETFQKLLSDKCQPGEIRKIWEKEQLKISGLWEAVAELGALGIMASESAGGFGLSEVDLAGLMEEAGKASLPEPFLEHAGIAVPALSSDLESELSQEWLPRCIRGEVVVSAGFQINEYVSHCQSADAFLLEHENSIFFVKAEDVEIELQNSLDASRDAGKIIWSPERAEKLKLDVDLAFERAVLAAAAESLGVAEKLLEMTVEYTAEREQFGKPVGSQQAVKHHLANVKIALEFARPSVYAAAWSVAENTADRSLNVSAAKALASSALNLACRQALQCHGAIGYTVEYDLNFWLKRGWVLAGSYGGEAFHNKRAAQLLELKGV